MRSCRPTTEAVQVRMLIWSQDRELDKRSHRFEIKRPARLGEIPMLVTLRMHFQETGCNLNRASFLIRV